MKNMGSADQSKFDPGILPSNVSLQTRFGRVVQIAYHAPDIPAAVDWFTAELGAGPFFLLKAIRLKSCLCYGKPGSFSHSSAYGQLGEIMIELIHQDDDAPSPVRDLFGASSSGLHHVAVFVEDLDATLDAAECAGHTVALDAVTVGGVRFVFLDQRPDFGYMLEFYERCAELNKFYDFVRRKSLAWDGQDPLRHL